MSKFVRACDRRGLGLGVWYLATVDIEDDGVDEVFVGVLDLGFSGNRTVRLWVLAEDDAMDGGIRLVGRQTNREAALYVSAEFRQGLGCVDHDGDGVRDLVIVREDDPASTDTTIGWYRSGVRINPRLEEFDPPPR